MAPVVVVLAVLLCVLFFVGFGLGAILTGMLKRFGLRLPWQRKQAEAAVDANLETISVEAARIPVHRPGRLNSAKSAEAAAAAAALPLVTRLSGKDLPLRQESLAAKTSRRPSLLQDPLREPLVKLSAEKLQEHTRSYAISASATSLTPSNVVAWDDGQIGGTRNSMQLSALGHDERGSLTLTGSLPLGSRGVSMDLLSSRELHADSGPVPSGAGTRPVILETAEGDAAPGEPLSEIPSTFSIRPTSPAASSSPFAVMAGLAPFAADTETSTPVRSPVATVRPMSGMAPMASLRLPRELSQKSLNMDLSKAWSDAANIAGSEVSKQAALNRLMTFDNPGGQTARPLDLDTLALGACLEVHMDEIDLAEQIGKGGFGAVYKGTWRGAPVAVKYGPCAVGDAEALERCLREVVLAKHMSHPNVVQTYAWTMLTGPQASNVDNDEDERRTVQRALQNNVGANAQKAPILQPANSADLGPATPRHHRIQELYHDSRSQSGALSPIGSGIGLASPSASSAAALDLVVTAPAQASRAAASLLMSESSACPASRRARVSSLPASPFAQSPPTRRRESLDSTRSVFSARYPSPLKRQSAEVRRQSTEGRRQSTEGRRHSVEVRRKTGASAEASPEAEADETPGPSPPTGIRNRRVSAPVYGYATLQRSHSLNSLASRNCRSLDKLVLSPTGSKMHRRRSMDSPVMRQALKDAARKFAQACASKEGAQDLTPEASNSSLQGMQGLETQGLDGPRRAYGSMPLSFSREAFQRELAASDELSALEHETPRRRLPNLNVEIVAGLQTVISHTFSDIAGMNSPGDQLLAASPQPNTNTQAYAFQRLSPPVPTVSPNTTPPSTAQHHTPDSFNRAPGPGHGIFDGAAPTPIQIRTPRRPGERGSGPRARRRLAYPAPDAEVDVLAELGEVRPLGLSNLAPRGETLMRQVSSNSLHSGNEDAGSPRMRSMDLKRMSIDVVSMSRASSGTSLVLNSKATPHVRGEPPFVVVSSPRRSQAPSSPFASAPNLPSSPFAAPQLASVGFNSNEGQRPRGPGSEIGDLEVAVRACSMASVRSNASFNSEEGFGSPSTNRRIKNRHPMPEMAESSFEGGKAVVVVIMEFCDMGTLLRAITKQAFKPHGKWKLHTTYRALLRTAQEVAKGMDYIHSCGIIHGDLKAGNVLLKTHRIDRRGYIAKVADFGLSRSLEANAMQVAVGNQLGTVAYTAPEIFRDSVVTKPSDVYAFGVLMWEIYHCAQAYDGMMEGQICLGVCEHTLRPEFAEDCPEPYSRLAKSCWHQDPTQRPTFHQVVAALTKIETEFRRDCHRGRLPPTSRVLNRRATATGAVEQTEASMSPRAPRSLRRNVTASIIPERSEPTAEDQDRPFASRR